MQEPGNNLKEHPDLYKRSIKGGYWVFAIRFATQLLGFVKSIIIFNVLFSENLELIIVANLLMAILNRFSESGFHAALVQKKENIADYLDTAWVIGILRGIALFIAIYFAAPLFVSFRVDPEDLPLAVSVIRAMGVCFLIRAFQNIGVVYFQKELQFHKTFGLTMVGTLTDIVLSITLVLIYKSVWAYVIARLVSAAVNCVMSYWLCSYRPKFHFVPQKARELWKFGKWLFGGNIIGYLLNEGDDWFVWFYLGGGPLKLYRYAYNFSNLPATHITNTISQVSFPAYSKIQNDIPRLREAYLKVLQITALVSIPTAFLIFTLGPEFVRLFLVEESHAMIPVIQILAFKGLMGSLTAAWSPLFRAFGKPKIITYLLCFGFIVLGVTIYPFTKMWGITGTALSTLSIGIFVNPYGHLLVGRLLKCPVWKILKVYLIPLIASFAMLLIIIFLKAYIFVEITHALFFVLSMVAVIIYIAGLLLFDTTALLNCGIRQICVEYMNQFLKPTKK